MAGDRLPYGTVKLLATKHPGIPWQLTVHRVKATRDELRWQQYIRGGYTLYDSAGNSLEYSNADQILRYHPGAQKSSDGKWIEDFPMSLELDSGKRELGTWAKCTGFNRRTPNVSCETYSTSDLAGFNKALPFGRMVHWGAARRTLIGIGYDAWFHYKIWMVGQESRPYYEIQFVITGGYGAKMSAAKGRVRIPRPTIEVKFQRSCVIPAEE